MIKIEKQLNAGEYTVLCLNQPVPVGLKKKIVIDDKEYETEIVYDLPNSIGIKGHGTFVGKKILI